MAMTRETSKPIAACGTEVTASKLVEGLRAAGLQARAFALVKLEMRDDWHAGLDLGSYDWIVLASPTAAQITLAKLGGIFTGRFACVGTSTAAVVKAAGFSVAVVPTEQTRKGLLAALVGQRRGQSLLLPMSDAAPNELWDGLKKLGFIVAAPVTYSNQPGEQPMRDFARAVAGGEFSAAAFTSASAFNYASVAHGIEKLRLYCIGPSTAEAVWAKKLKVAGMPDHHNVGGLVKTIVEVEQRG